jgi:hypothetical protein
MQYGIGGGPAKFALLACMCISMTGSGNDFFAVGEVLEILNFPSLPGLF